MASKCKFQGPAGTTFATFAEQALFSLNNCCPRWNDNNNPRSYMIPPIFYFKHPEIPDHELEEIKQPGEFNRDMIDRTSDDAEQMIFDALKILIDDGFLAPFVVFHDFSLNRVSVHLGKLFPGLSSTVINKKFGEYDFVLIGPKIGIVVIEVKSTPFTGSRDFNTNLPEQYEHGIEQLRSFDSVLDLHDLLRVTTTTTNREHIRRILFTPNLTKARFDHWFASLDEARRNDTNKIIDGIDRWFQEDTSELYAKFRSYLDGNQSTYHMHPSLYEQNPQCWIYIPILSGLLSVTFTKTSIDIDTKTLSMEEAALRVSDCVERQDPWSLDPSPKRRKVDRSANQTIELWKTVILTPEQLAALGGPLRQFIIGAAGTGKTIILQAKALELLGKGESVLVLCEDNYIGIYNDLFDRHKLKGFLVKRWSYHSVPAELAEKLIPTGEFGADVNTVRSYVHQFLKDPTKKTRLASFFEDCFEDYFEQLNGHGHILIDDAFVSDTVLANIEVSSVVLYPMLLMAYMEQASSRKTVWIAFDPFAAYTFFYSMQKQQTDDAAPNAQQCNSTRRIYPREPYDALLRAKLILNDANIQSASCFFDVSYLKHAMRNPENIFGHVFPTSGIGPYLAPTIGHKIHGARSVKTFYSYEELAQEITVLLESVKDKYQIEQIAIITSAHRRGMAERLASCLERQGVLCGNQYLLIRRNRSDKSWHKYPTRLACKQLAIYEWDQVHSMEWPVVFYIENMQDPGSIALPRNYVACSRATGMLIECQMQNGFEKVRKNGFL